MKLRSTNQEGCQMKKLFLIKLVVLLLTTAMLSGCVWGPGWFWHHPKAGHDNGHHGHDKHDRD
jgi:hypothetical protein